MKKKKERKKKNLNLAQELNNEHINQVNNSTIKKCFMLPD